MMRYAANTCALKTQAEPHLDCIDRLSARGSKSKTARLFAPQISMQPHKLQATSHRSRALRNRQSPLIPQNIATSANWLARVEACTALRTESSRERALWDGLETFPDFVIMHLMCLLSNAPAKQIFGDADVNRQVKHCIKVP